MRKGIGFSGLVVFLLLTLLPGLTMADRGDGSGMMAGVIRDATTGLPVANILVRATNMLTSDIERDYWDYQEARTNANGEYLIMDLRTGDYRVEVFPTGDYMRTYYKDVYYDAEATLVRAVDGQTVRGIDINVGVYGKITGEVRKLTDDGIMLGHIQIIAVSDNGHRYTTYTADNGFYSLDKLPPGRYVVNANPSASVNLFGQYYDHVYSVSEATWIEVEQKRTVYGIDFHLTPGGTLSGVVTHGDQGTPIPGVSVVLELNGRIIKSTSTDDQGKYKFVHLATDNYTVKADPGLYSDFLGEYYRDAYTAADATPVYVQIQNDTRNIDFSLSKGGRIKGRVTRYSDGQPVPGVTVYALTSSGEVVSSNITDEDGFYTIRRLREGAYILRADPAANSKLLRTYYPNFYEFARGVPVNVYYEKTTEDIDIALRAGGQIKGRITDIQTAAGIMGMTVAALGGNGETYSSTSVPNGDFTITGLPSGQYKVYVEPGETCRYLKEYYDDSGFMAGATPVDVVVNEATTGIDFALTPGGIVSGRVTRFPDGLPVQGMKIVARLSSTQSYQGVTQADGTYKIIGLPSGRYLVMASAGTTGFFSVYYNNAYFENDATWIDVVAQETVADIDFQVSRGGKISGAVIRDPDCRPAPCRDLCADRCADEDADSQAQCVSECEAPCLERCETQCEGQSDGQACIDQCMERVPTDYNPLDICGFPISGMRVIARGIHGRIDEGYTAEDGTYEIAGLLPGRYTVEIEPAASSGYLKSYYQDVLDAALATSVEVFPQETTRAIDFHVLRGGKIGGVVYRRSDHAPVADMKVTAESEDGKQYSVYSGSNGNYLITGLPDGAYTVRVEPDPGSEYLPGDYEGGKIYIHLDVTDSNWNPAEIHVDLPLTTGGRIAGFIRRLVDRHAIEGMRVRAVSETGDDAEAISMADGSYLIKKLPKGNYTVWIEPATGSDYIGMYYQNVFDWNLATPVAVEVEETALDIDFDVVRGGSISGNVFYAVDDTPISGRKVEAESVIGGVKRYAVSDENGHYSITGLRGQYVVYIENYGVGNYVPEFYDNVSDKNLATHVIVEEERSYTGVDFSLNAGGAISGSVFREDDGSPVPGVVVRVALNGQVVRETRTNAEGYYLLERLDGDYTISAVPPADSELLEVFYNGVLKQSEATPIGVALNEENSRIDFALPVGGRISGRVNRNLGNTPEPNMKLEIKAIYGGKIKYVFTQPDGSYEAVGLSDGKYSVRIDPDLSTGFLAVYYNDKVLFEDANVLRIVDHNTRSNIDFNVIKGGIVSGVIRYAGQPVAGALVSAVHAESGIKYPAVTTDAEGRYRIIGLPTGQYSIYVNPMYVDGYVRDYYTITNESIMVERVDVEVEQTTEDIDIALITDAPGRPVPVTPVDGTASLDLTPELTVEPYAYPVENESVENAEEERYHAKTEWQIATDREFKELVFDVQSEYFMENLHVPPLVLDKLTVYYWRARFYDNLGKVSEWSVPFAFETGAVEWIDANNDGMQDESEIIQDNDGNGVPDGMEIDNAVDIDSNGIIDVEQGMIRCLFTGNASDPVGVKWFYDNHEVVAMRISNFQGLPDHEGKPDEMMYGLISFKIITYERVEVIVYLDDPALQSAGWYLYNPANAWELYSDTVNGEMGAYRKFVILKIEDGGVGDIDGVKNGVIVHQGGIGLVKEIKADETLYDDNTRGCFTGSVAAGTPLFMGGLMAATLLLAGVLSVRGKRR